MNAHTILSDMLADFGHGVAHVGVGVKQVVVLLRLPIGEGGEFLGDRLEEPDDDPNGRGLHITAEFIDSRRILSRG